MQPVGCTPWCSTDATVVAMSHDVVISRTFTAENMVRIVLWVKAIVIFCLDANRKAHSHTNMSLRMKPATQLPPLSTLKAFLTDLLGDVTWVFRHTPYEWPDCHIIWWGLPTADRRHPQLLVEVEWIYNPLTKVIIKWIMEDLEELFSFSTVSWVQHSAIGNWAIQWLKIRQIASFHRHCPPANFSLNTVCFSLATTMMNPLSCI